ncbi:uncharacterized protein Dana_GF16833 [Drosophila ananassae]|uniref:Uncharacterized protein n=1 Tax=Drosophila ananassae TaxID=7217 RepID=B3LXX2_DROAN|nr:uncharacterized protein LOC6499627 [Drosophila ananassae]EDV42828.1 uncharacterized protein Dana_GF16833 [Drosophila ananassae]
MTEDQALLPAAESEERIGSLRQRFAEQGSNVTSRVVRSVDSTRLLFMGSNFQHGRCDQDVFYDCQSNGEDSPREGRSGTSRSATSRSVTSKCRLDDPAAIRQALERAANATNTLLKNFDNSGGWNNPCAVTLEITARLVDPKKTRSGCPLHGKPVTVQMPLQFNPQGGGKLTTCQKRELPRPRHQSSGSVCQCRTGAPKAKKPCPGKSESQQQFFQSESHVSRSDASAYMGSCGDSTICCHSRIYQNRYQPDEREVISISYLSVPETNQIWEEEATVEDIKPPLPPPEKIEEPPVEPEPVPEEHIKIEAPPQEDEDESDTETVSESEPSTATVVLFDEPEPETSAPSGKKYYLARPQNKEFSNCSPCRFDPSPIMDEEGNVFCPGNCGCCMCPWKRRTFEENREHINVKVCRCVQRGTIFTKFEDREVCSQTSYFDFCPCREKAEAKFLELYHTEMWSSPDNTRGREIQLSEIKELLVPLRQYE